MKKQTAAIFIPGIKVICLVLISTYSLAQDAWIRYLNPAEIHEMMGKYTGDFQMKISSFGEAGQDSVSFLVESNHEMILGGRFLEMKQSGTIMGMDYQGVFLWGYNTIDSEFNLMTISNMGTGTLSLTGKWDSQLKTASLTGKLTNPMTKKPIQIRQLVHFPDPDTILIESFDQEGNNPELKMREYLFTRKK